MTRRENDAYYTPGWAVEQLIRHRNHVVGRANEVVVEPCVGEGAIADPFRRRGAVVYTNDLVPTIDADVHGDAQTSHTWRAIIDHAIAHTKTEPFNGVAIDWTVTNPPFVAAMEILKQAHAHSRIGVAMFLRLSFLEPTEDRGPWLAAHPPDDLIVVPRISFTGDGKTDNVTCAWMIWYTDRDYVMRAPRQPIVIVEKEPDDVDTHAGSLFGEDRI